MDPRAAHLTDDELQAELDRRRAEAAAPPMTDDEIQAELDDRRAAIPTAPEDATTPPPADPLAPTGDLEGNAGAGDGVGNAEPEDDPVRNADELVELLSIGGEPISAWTRQGDGSTGRGRLYVAGGGLVVFRAVEPDPTEAVSA